MNRIGFAPGPAFGLVPAALRPRFYWLFPLMVAAALLEMIGLALIVPLVNAVAGTGAVDTVPILGRAVALFGDFAPEHAVIALAAAIAVFYLVKNAFLFLALYAENSFIMSAVLRAMARPSSSRPTGTPAPAYRSAAKMASPTVARRSTRRAT